MFDTFARTTVVPPVVMGSGDPTPIRRGKRIKGPTPRGKKKRTHYPGYITRTALGRALLSTVAFPR